MMDVDKILVESVGKWPGILEKLGIEVGNGKHRPCPLCQGKDRFRFINKDGRGEYICGQCGAGNGFSLVQKVLGVDFLGACRAVSDLLDIVEASPCQPEKTITPEALRKIYKESKPTKAVLSDPVWLYLQNRGLNTIPKNIRTTGKCWEPETQKDQIAMLALFQLPDGTAVTMHRTYLNKDGNKLQIQSPKKVLPALKPMAGGAVRLFDSLDGLIGVSEGIETAIAVFELLKVPCWAALNSSLMTAWEPTKDIKSVVVFGDNDKNYTGQKAAYVLANRLSIKGFTVEVEIPETVGNDWLDEAMKERQRQNKEVF